MRADGVDFATYLWDIVGGQPFQNSGPVAAKTPLSEKISELLKQRGFKFVGPVIVHAWMQATGMVNDHEVDCFRRAEVQQLGQR